VEKAMSEKKVFVEIKMPLGWMRAKKIMQTTTRMGAL
jgi:hypothetical protein